MVTSGCACAACMKIQRELQRRLSRKLAQQEICCFAGMIDLAVPVIVGGQQVATLLGGQVFRQKPGRRQFDRIREASNGATLEGAEPVSIFGKSGMKIINKFPVVVFAPLICAAMVRAQASELLFS